MGRTSDARDRILDAAQALIELRGYSALGVAEICKAAGVPKGSFYYFFESKEVLALAVIDEHWAVQGRDWERIMRSDTQPLQRLRQLFEETEAGQRAGFVPDALDHGVHRLRIADVDGVGPDGSAVLVC